MSSARNNSTHTTDGAVPFLSGDELPPWHRWLLWVLFGFSIFAAFGFPIYQHGANLWRREYFQFYPLFLFCAGWLVLERLKESETESLSRWRFSIPPLLLSVTVTMMSALLRSPLLAAVGCWFLGESLLAGFVNARRGWRLLCVLFPLPMGYDRVFIQKLQMTASNWGGAVLDIIGIPHLMRGNVLQLPGKQFFVEEACSGINSAYLLLATTVFFLVVYNVRLIRAVPILISVFWWAIVGNLFRIVAIAYAFHEFQTDLSTGWQHQVLGLGTMLFSFAMITLTALLCDGVFATLGSSDEVMNSASGVFTPTLIWDLLTVRDRTQVYGRGVDDPKGWDIARPYLFYPLSVFLLACGFLQLSPSALSAFTAAGNSNANVATDAAIPELSEQSLVASEDLVVTGFEDSPIDHPETVAAATRRWILQKADLEEAGHFQVQGPFAGWVDARSQFQKDGWKLLSSESVVATSTANANLLAVRLVDTSGRLGHLYFCCFDGNGALVAIPTEKSRQSLPGVFRRRLTDSVFGASSEHIWQAMMFLPQPVVLADQESMIKGEIRRFEGFLNQIISKWRDPE